MKRTDGLGGLLIRHHSRLGIMGLLLKDRSKPFLALDPILLASAHD